MGEQPTTQQLRALWAATVREKREAAGLSQRKLALTAGISHDAVNAIEHGEHGGSDQTRIALARVLGCEVHELFPYPTITEEAAS